MSQKITAIVVAVAMVAVMGLSSTASASHIRSIAQRRQHPNGHFFVQDTHRHCHTHYVSANNRR